MGITDRMMRHIRCYTYDFSAHFFSLTQHTDFDSFEKAMKGRSIADNVIHTREYMDSSMIDVKVDVSALRKAMEGW